MKLNINKKRKRNIFIIALILLILIFYLKSKEFSSVDTVNNTSIYSNQVYYSKLDKRLAFSIDDGFFESNLSEPNLKIKVVKTLKNNIDAKKNNITGNYNHIYQNQFISNSGSLYALDSSKIIWHVYSKDNIYQKIKLHDKLYNLDIELAYITKENNTYFLNVPNIITDSMDYENYYPTINKIFPLNGTYPVLKKNVVKIDKPEILSVNIYKINLSNGKIKKEDISSNIKYNKSLKQDLYDLYNPRKDTKNIVDYTNISNILGNNNGYQKIIIKNGYQFYMENKNAPIFKKMPKLKQYLKKNPDKDMITIYFKGDNKTEFFKLLNQK